MSYGLGASDGRRSRKPQLISNLGQMPFTSSQKATLDAKAFALQNSPPWINPAISANSNSPSTGNPFVWTPASSGNVNQPFTAYPQPGAGKIIVLSYTVRRSKTAWIRYLSISHFGGNDPSGTGQVIWRVLKNGGGVRGLNNLNATLGTYAAPQLLPAPIIGIENDTIQVTVEVPAGFQPLGNTAGTSATFVGFELSISEATTPQQGTY